MARVYDRLRSHVQPRDLKDIWLENIPQYDLYEDDTQNDEHFLQGARAHASGERPLYRS